MTRFEKNPIFLKTLTHQGFFVSLQIRVFFLKKKLVLFLKKAKTPF